MRILVPTLLLAGIAWGCTPAAGPGISPLDGSVDPSQPDAGVDVSQLDGERYTLQVDRIALNPDVQFPVESLEESDYEQIEDGNRYEVRFAETPEAVTVSGQPAGEAPLVMTGSLAVDTDDFRGYGIDVGLFAGGRFNVWIADEHFEAELTVYGSGVPIVRSERGRLVAAN